MVLKVRDTLVGQQTLLVNTQRGHAAEFGVIAAKALGRIDGLLEAIAADPAIPPAAREMLGLLGEEITQLAARIEAIGHPSAGHAQGRRGEPDSGGHPGIGPVGALTLATEVDPAAFESGRHLAAWMGLTPREHSTGGKQRMGGISRAGHERLRQLLVLGATSIIKVAERPGNTSATDWLRALLKRKPRKLAAVALANKMARMAWPVMTRREAYRPRVAKTMAAAA